MFCNFASAWHDNLNISLTNFQMQITFLNSICPNKLCSKSIRTQCTLSHISDVTVKFSHCEASNSFMWCRRCFVPVRLMSIIIAQISSLQLWIKFVILRWTGKYTIMFIFRTNNYLTIILRTTKTNLPFNYTLVSSNICHKSIIISVTTRTIRKINSYTFPRRKTLAERFLLSTDRWTRK